MSWVPKSTSPPTFDLAAAFLALISGDTTWDWLAPWVPLAPDTIFSTADFCSAGPVASPPFTLADFVGGGQRDGGKELVTGTALLGWKVAAAMSSRVFGAMCENNSGSGLVWSAYECHDMDRNAPSGGYSTVAVPIPEGTVELLYEWSNEADIQYGDAYIYLSDTATQPTTLHDNNTSPFIGRWPVGDGSLGTTPHGPVAVGSNTYVILQTNGTGVTVCFSWHEPAGGTPYDVPPQPEPPGVLPPATLVYPDIAALGAELDRQELKLDAILALAQLLVALSAEISANTLSAPVGVVGGVGLEVIGAAGIVVTVATVPDGVDEIFTTPRLYKRLGQAIFTNASGVTSVVDLDATPKVIAPLPPLTTHVAVNVFPGATASVQLIPFT